jgi:CPA2 family monovalent cation:H+ antiporter-2
MPHNMDLLLTITGSLTAALLFGFGTHRLGLSPIVGYLLAGMAVSPFTPGFIAHAQLAEQLAEIGVILLMFGVGLHFHLNELLAVRRIAVPGAVVQIAVAAALGTLVGIAFGWTASAGLVYGLAVSVASTVVLLRVLADADALSTPIGHLAVGWLIVEDVFTVLVLVILPVLFASGGDASAAATVVAVVKALGKIALLVAFTWLAGRRAIPAFLGYVAKTRSRELFTLTVLVLALGIAVGSARLFGTSMALGAFLAGMVVGQSQYGARAASEALPMRDAFAVLFFVSIGMLFNPRELVATLPLSLATLAIVLFGKPLAAVLVVIALRRPRKTALAVAAALAQIGEFSFIVSSLGIHLGVLPNAAAQALVIAAIVSITLNPLLFKAVDPLLRRFGHGSRPTALTESDPSDELEQPEAIVVGHGPVGRTVTRLLRAHGVTLSVIDLNDETVAELTRSGVRAVYGDASQEGVLKAAGAERARIVIATAATGSDETVIEAAKRLNPNVEVYVRANFVAQCTSLNRAGADVVVAGEGEVALALAERVLARFGASEEQVGRERKRLRGEFEL